MLVPKKAWQRFRYASLKKLEVIELFGKFNVFSDDVRKRISCHSETFFQLCVADEKLMVAI